MFTKTNPEPITIVVKEGRWDAYGSVTRRSKFLYKMLDAMGGVNENVPDGTYHFNVRRIGFTIVTTLTPAKD